MLLAFVHLCLLREGRLDSLSTHQFLVPLPGLRILLLPLFVEASAHDTFKRDLVPRQEHEICKAGFVADQVWLSSFAELQLNDTQHTVDLVGIALNGRSEVLLWVVLRQTSVGLPTSRELVVWY